ncbi:secreted protein [Herbihabitans rhizosphaerae]|uniref:Secreted protein n=1 Tax=Herbihabitans rhizosphaerae TaxID=1872711 RepID=A0A4Q7KL53_9PSEU|nr:FAD-binding oxidoreductase [Herbihabitans rhizosphaerae]RZS36954.1 secreted protein [Herbihabitans rhizosphaerae]
MSTTRRDLLRAAGLSTAALALGACSDKTPPGQGTPFPTLPPRPTTTVPPGTTASTPPSGGPPDWQALRDRLGGALVLPDDRSYAVAKQSFNPVFDSRAPAAVARCSSAEHVRACVETARNARIPIAARGGGHSYAGYSVPDRGLVVDLGGMSDVKVNADGTATIGAGARLMGVYTALAEAGRCLPAGSCPTVGIAGLTLGGGIGVLSRKYGLTCDKLVSAQVVTADGRLRTASAESERDLFWALRGGGGGNLGIVTSFTFATEPAPGIAVFGLRFPAGSAVEVAGAWQEWMGGAPDELWSSLVISGGNPPSARISGSFVGPSAALNDHLARLIGRIGRSPSSKLVQDKGFLDAMRYYGGCSTRPAAQCRPQSEGGALGRDAFVASSRILTRPADAGRLVELMNGRTGMDLLVDSLGGAVSRVDSRATAFPHRSAFASAQIYQGTGGAGAQRATQAVSEVRDGLGQLVGQAAYVNYIDPSLPDWAAAYYGDNLGVIRDLARKYDPSGLFTFAQGFARA